ncbi:MAG: cation diffusion facilitator family transporter [Firmicutes bacterium]|nr:cation diffusion facilitator family transporter [Bacillota bacterium]
MKKESSVLIFSAIINIIVSSIKITCGIYYNSYTFVADGYYTISDLITDIIALISAKVSHRRANKKYPFGFGRVEYICQMFIGFIIIFIGFFVIIDSFSHKYVEPNLNIIYFILIAIFLKILSSNYLLDVGRKIRSQILTISAKESFSDVFSTSCVFIIIIIARFYPPFDLIGTIIIALLIMSSGIKIIKDNVLALIGEDINNEEIKLFVKENIEKHQDILYSDSALIKTGNYYLANIEIAVDEHMKLNRLIKLENKIKKELKKSKYKIKFIEFDIIAK